MSLDNTSNFGGRYTGREVVGAVFTDQDDAAAAVEDLKNRNYRADQIGVAVRAPDAVATPGTTTIRREEEGSHAGSGAVAGALGGGALGALAGWLVAAAGLAIPGVGPVLVGGSLAAAMGSTAAATAVAGAGIGAAGGGVVGALTGWGVPDEEARYFDERFRAGQVLVTVRAPDVTEAANILKAHDGDLGPEAERTREDVVGMTTGAAVGAVAGAIVGSIPGALVGEVIGGAAGAAIGKAAQPKKN